MMKRKEEKLFNLLVSIMVMVCVSITSMTIAFATDDQRGSGDSGEGTNTENTDENNDPNVPITPPVPEPTPIEELKPGRAKISKTVSSYKSIKITWKAVANKSDGRAVVFYQLYRYNKDKKKWKKIYGDTKKLTYTDKNLDPRFDYKYKVRAIYKSLDGKTKLGVNGAFSAIVKDAPVKPAYIRFTTAKTGKYYTSKTGGTAGGYFGGNTVVYAEGGIAGRYAVPLKPSKMGNDKVGYYNIFNAKNVKMYVDKKGNKDYTKEEIESYVNTRKVTSRTKWLIMVSTFKQRVYIFKKKGGKWALQGKSFKCNTGRVRSPSPTGMRSVLEKDPAFQSTRGNGRLRYLTCIYSYTGFHKNFATPPLGQPASSGCIRLHVNKAKYIFDTIPLRTTVLVY